MRQINAAGLNCMQPQGFGRDFVPKKMLRQKRRFGEAGGIPPGEEIQHRRVPGNHKFPELGRASLRRLQQFCEQLVDAAKDALPQNGCIACLRPFHAGENVRPKRCLRITPPGRRGRATLQAPCRIESGRNGGRPEINRRTKRITLRQPVLRHSGNALHHDSRALLRQLYAGIPQHRRLA